MNVNFFTGVAKVLNHIKNLIYFTSVKIHADHGNNRRHYSRNLRNRL